MYFIDFEQTKSVYEILGVPRTVPLKQLQNAYREYTRPLQKAIDKEGDRVAEQKLKELSSLKDKIWKAEARAQYDASLGEAPSFEFHDPVPAHFGSRTALIRAFRNHMLSGEVPARYATVLPRSRAAGPPVSALLKTPRIPPEQTP